MRRAVLLLAAVACLPLFVPAPAGAIVGGQPADPGEWPWYARLVVDGETLCGGSLLELGVVVTAAHCSEGLDASDIEVEAGSVEADGAEAQRRPVTTIVEHEDYDDETLENDIALLFLVEPFERSAAVEPVALPDLALEEARTDGGDPAVVTGFGVIDEDGTATSAILREGEIEIIADATCRDDYGGDEEVFVDLMVCAGFQTGGVDACFGDSGGPLVVPADDGRTAWFLVGIVSWGDGCGRRRAPTVYTEIGPQLAWLSEQLAPTADGLRFESDGGARIPALGSVGKAGPFPLTVDVRGVDAVVSSVAVELSGLRHERASDLDIWLQAPDATTVTLLSDVGGNEPIDDATVLVDSAGPTAGDAPFGLRASPSDLQADRQRKGPPPPPDLSRLAGIDPNGEWRLLVADDRRGGRGRVDSWALILD